MRKLLAIVSGIVAGYLLSSSMTAGLRFRFPDEFAANEWGVLLWGEHWFIRFLVSSICAAWAGFIAGLIGRDKGKLLGILAVTPGWLIWVIAIHVSLTGHLPFIESALIYSYASLGNKISMATIILAMFPIAWVAGQYGEMLGQENAKHFDSRCHTLLGIKWYHYFWLSIVIHLIVMQGSYVGLYFLEWLKVLWKTDFIFSFFAYIIPGIFTVMLYGTLYIMWLGISKTYLILAGFENVSLDESTTLKILKYALGFPIMATILQSIIQFIHYSIAKWVS